MTTLDRNSLLCSAQKGKNEPIYLSRIVHFCPGKRRCITNFAPLFIRCVRCPVASEPGQVPGMAGRWLRHCIEDEHQCFCSKSTNATSPSRGCANPSLSPCEHTYVYTMTKIPVEHSLPMRVHKQITLNLLLAGI